MEDLQNLILLQHTKEPVQEDFQANRDGLGSIEHEAANIEHHIGLDNLHLTCWIYRGNPQLTQS